MHIFRERRFDTDLLSLQGLYINYSLFYLSLVE
jgi:hypothetical protein